MESKKVKIVDEHSINRDANVICGFTVDNSKYVLYSIERNEEGDNILVSKLTDNIDHTSNMVNIEDEMEKIKIDEIVKDLITYSLRNENDHTGREVELPGGNKVTIVDVLFNKEQSINVTKTYVATVKKSVTKVSDEFYKVDEKQEEDLEATTIFESLPNDIVESETEKVDEKQDLSSSLPQLETSEEDAPENKELEIPADLLKSEEEKPEVPKEKEVAVEVEIPQIEPIAEVKNEVSEDGKEVTPEVEPVQILPVESETIKNEETPQLELPNNLLDAKEEKPVEMAEEKREEEEKAPEHEITPVVAAPLVDALSAENEPAKVETLSSEPKLFFDGSSESNLNKALGEVTDEKVVTAPQDGVQSLREFGVDEPASNEVAETPVVEDVKTLKRSKGFANNKFFMVVAIVFFIAACVFLGYEAFQYFTLK